MVGPKDEAGNPVQRDLTPAERDAMLKDLRQAKAGNALRDVVASWGVPQYPFVAAGFLLGASLLLRSRARRSSRGLGLLGVCVSAAAGVLAIYRGYWASLGW